MTDNEFINAGKKQCSSLKVVMKIDGILDGPHSTTVDYNLNGKTMHIKIEQMCVRKITISVDSPISMRKLWDFYGIIERLLMLFDGRFYILQSVTFIGNTCADADYALYAQECQARRLPYYKTDSAYCYSDHVFLEYDTVLNSKMLSNWVKLQDELDIVNQVVLYNMAATGITHDVKCANLVECFEPLVEIIGIYDKFFPSLTPGDRKTTLKMCIDAVISKYGYDIFNEEYSKNKDKFLQILVNTRVRIMHIKRNQPTGKFFSAPESILYMVKLCHLYRVVIISLLGIDYGQYRSAVINSVGLWNSWQNVLVDFLKAI